MSIYFLLLIYDNIIKAKFALFGNLNAKFDFGGSF